MGFEDLLGTTAGTPSGDAGGSVDSLQRLASGSVFQWGTESSLQRLAESSHVSRLAQQQPAPAPVPVPDDLPLYQPRAAQQQQTMSGFDYGANLSQGSRALALWESMPQEEKDAINKQYAQARQQQENIRQARTEAYGSLGMNAGAARSTYEALSGLTFGGLPYLFGKAAPQTKQAFEQATDVNTSMLGALTGNPNSPAMRQTEDVLAPVAGQLTGFAALTMAMQPEVAAGALTSEMSGALTFGGGAAMQQTFNLATLSDALAERVRRGEISPVEAKTTQSRAEQESLRDVGLSTFTGYLLPGASKLGEEIFGGSPVRDALGRVAGTGTTFVGQQLANEALGGRPTTGTDFATSAAMGLFGAGGHRIPGIADRTAGFVESMAPYAQRAAEATGLPRDFIVAQWAHESNFGQSSVAKNTGNFAGIKTSAAAASGEDAYRTFDSKTAFTDSYIRTINSDRYAHVRDLARAGATPQEIADALHVAGYAEDPQYGVKVAARAGQVAKVFGQTTASTSQPAEQSATAQPAATQPAEAPDAKGEALARDVQQSIEAIGSANESSAPVTPARVPRAEMGLGDHAPYQSGQYVTDQPFTEHEKITKPGETMTGVVANDLTYEQARAIDPYAFAKDNGFFIHEEHVARPEGFTEEQPQPQENIDATTTRPIEESSQPEYQNGDDGRTAAEAGDRDRTIESGTREEKVETPRTVETPQARAEERVTTPPPAPEHAATEVPAAPEVPRERDAMQPRTESDVRELGNTIASREQADRAEGLREMQSKNIAPAAIEEPDIPGLKTEPPPAAAPETGGKLSAVVIPGLNHPRVERMLENAVFDTYEGIVKAKDAMKDFGRGLLNIFNPASAADLQSRNIATGGLAKRLRTETIADLMFDGVERHLNKFYTEGQKLAVWDKLERGETTGDMFIDRAFQAAKPMLRDALETEKQFMDIGDVGENYIPRHLRIIPGTGKSAPDISTFRIFAGSRPMQGRAGFAKSRTFESVLDIYKGDKPGDLLSRNPFTNIKMRLAEGARWVGWADMWEKAKEHGKATFVLTKPFDELPDEAKIALANRTSTELPEGFQPVTPETSSVYMKKAERVPDHGYWAVERGFYTLMKNHLARDVIRDVAAGRTLLHVKNFYTSVRLASGFHALFTAGSATDMGIHRAMQHLMSAVFHPTQAGEYMRALADQVKADKGVPFVTDVKLGSTVKQYLSDYDNPQSFLKSAAGQYLQTTMNRIAPGVNPERMIDLMFHAGIAPKSSALTRLRAVEDFSEAIRQDRVLRALFKSPEAAAEAAMYPIQELQVPLEKVGVFMKEFGLWRMQHADDIADRRTTEEEGARQIGRMIENTFGQVNYDFNFFHPVVKTVAQLMLNSPGWKLGNIRNLVGALPGQAKEIGMAIRGGHMPNIDPRVTWGAAMLLRTMATSAAITYAGTSLFGKGGRMPRGAEWIFPVASEVGEKAMHLMPLSYAADYIAASRNWSEYFLHSLSGPVTKTIEVLKNEDYFHNAIVDRHDSGLKATGERLGHIFMPDNLAFNNFSEERKRMAGGGLGEDVVDDSKWYSPKNIGLVATSYFGIMRPAPGYIERSPAQEFLSERSKEARQSAPYTREQQDEFARAVAYKSALEAATASGKSVDHSALLKQYHLTEERALQITKAMATGQQPDVAKFSRLENVQDAIDYYELADPNEKAAVKEEFGKKIEQSNRYTDEEKDALYKKYDLTPPPLTQKKLESLVQKRALVDAIGPIEATRQAEREKEERKARSGRRLPTAPRLPGIPKP